jgi:DNA repair protein RecO (recombination protein O)
MPSRTSEAFILRTHPYAEGDLIVSFLARDQGKLRGVAKRARRTRSSFGSSLERLSQVRVSYNSRENAELVRIDASELIQSQFGLIGCYEASVALDLIAEVTDQLLPASEPNEKFFRLIVSVLADLRSTAPTDLPKAIWRSVLYFAYWSVRLGGFLPELRVSASSRDLARALATTPVAALSAVEWDKTTGQDLRRFLFREIEHHLERRMTTFPILESL